LRKKAPNKRSKNGDALKIGRIAGWTGIYRLMRRPTAISPEWTWRNALTDVERVAAGSPDAPRRSRNARSNEKLKIVKETPLRADLIAVSQWTAGPIASSFLIERLDRRIDCACIDRSGIAIRMTDARSIH
jgi:hypothetical protein